MKYCPSCETKKNKNYFYSNKSRKDGVGIYCIECIKKKDNKKQEEKIKERIKKQFIEGEIWKDVTELNGYEVSTEGRLRNKKTKVDHS